MEPEMIVGMLLEMATGDENMPKGGHPDDLEALESSDANEDAPWASEGIPIGSKRVQ